MNLPFHGLFIHTVAVCLVCEKLAVCCVNYKLAVGCVVMTGPFFVVRYKVAVCCDVITGRLLGWL